VAVAPLTLTIEAEPLVEPATVRFPEAESEASWLRLSTAKATTNGSLVRRT
jgi:hypothetical protein